MTYAPIKNFLGGLQEIPEIRTAEWDYERDGPNPLEGFGPIGPYRPELDESEIVPLSGGFSDLLALLSQKPQQPTMVAAAKNKLSTPYWDKRKQYDDYLKQQDLLRKHFGWGIQARNTPALPGEPGRPGVPTAPPWGPSLPGEPKPLKLAINFLSNFLGA